MKRYNIEEKGYDYVDIFYVYVLGRMYREKYFHKRKCSFASNNSEIQKEHSLYKTDSNKENIKNEDKSKLDSYVAHTIECMDTVTLWFDNDGNTLGSFDSISYRPDRDFDTAPLSTPKEMISIPKWNDWLNKKRMETKEIPLHLLIAGAETLTFENMITQMAQLPLSSIHYISPNKRLVTTGLVNVENIPLERKTKNTTSVVQIAPKRFHKTVSIIRFELPALGWDPWCIMY